MRGEADHLCDLRRELSELVGFHVPRGRPAIHQLDKRAADGHARIAVEDGGHAVTRERFDLMVQWALGQSAARADPTMGAAEG